MKERLLKLLDVVDVPLSLPQIARVLQVQDASESKILSQLIEEEKEAGRIASRIGYCHFLRDRVILYFKNRANQ